MKWSWRIARVSGIGIHIHATFPLLLIWAALVLYQNRGTLTAVVAGIVVVLGVFGIVLLHEFGHALAARRFGIGTRRITLLPIGGLAELEGMPDEPLQELIIAAAGPAVNLLLALIALGLQLTLGDALHGTSPWFSGLGLPGGSPLTGLIWINLWLAGFNLLPAFPMDGGRILRALLALRRGRDWRGATTVAARVGRGFAIIFGLVGILFNPMLVLIALFIWVGVTGEVRAVNLRSTLELIPVERVMITELHTLEADDPLSYAIGHILAGFQEDFPVLDDGLLVGMLTRADLLDALARLGPGGRVEEVMRPDFHTVQSTATAWSSYSSFRDGQRSLPVLDDGLLVGLLTLDNIAEYMAFQEALHGKEPPGREPPGGDHQIGTGGSSGRSSPTSIQESGSSIGSR